MNEDIIHRIWEWLPGRTDGRRVTLPVTIAGALDLPVPVVVSTLGAMERAGHAIRDAATGLQTGWHRGTRPPAAHAETVVEEVPPTLF